MTIRLDPSVVAAIYAAELSPDDFKRALQEELAREAETGEARAHIEWFMKRYPTALERLRFSERLRRDWTRPPVPGGPEPR